MANRSNILVIGASGGVAAAFLERLVPERSRIRNLVLVDHRDLPGRTERVLQGLPDHEFVKTFVNLDKDRPQYQELLRAHGVQVVVDLSVNETRAMLQATDREGVSYVNTGIANRRGENFASVVLDLCSRKKRSWRTPHILCAGMNPGIVNMWVHQGIERYGVPQRIVHFEYDGGQPIQGWAPVITWSRETFLDEIVNDPAGWMEGRGRPGSLYPNALKHRMFMGPVLSPIMKMEPYPSGFLLLHEENITLSQCYDIPSRFLFAVDNRTMDYLESLYDRKGTIPLQALILGDNQKVRLTGAVTIGVCLKYPDRDVYFFNRTRHDAQDGVSGSCWQVGAGLHAALMTLLDDDLPAHLHFVEDLADSSCRERIKEALPMERQVAEHDTPRVEHG